MRKWAKFTLRWGVAALGVTWVLLRTSFHDHVLIVDKNNQTQQIRIEDGQPQDANQFWVFYGGQRQYPITRNDAWTPPGDRSSVPIWGRDEKKQNATVLAIHPAPDQQPNQSPAQLLVRDPQTEQPRIIKPTEVAGGYTVRVVYPLVEVGLIRLVREARPLYLLLAVALLPICFLITSIRWHSLLEAQDIHISFSLAFVLNMVGAFYNSFMPGSTGGDLVKAYYAAKHTTHRTRAVMTVIIDRLLGLLALIIVGGIMAAVQYNIPTCRHVAIISGALILATLVGLFVFYHPNLRRKTGLEWLLKRLPMQRQVHKAVEAMELYGKRPWVAIWAVIITFPVHITTIISATFAGKAFLLPLGAMYYWVIVPVIALVGAIPISPQGVGVMEPLAVELTRRQGVTVSQAFALVMAIRFSQIFWNVLASIFVLRGGYHAVTESEAEELEHDDEDAPRPGQITELSVEELQGQSGGTEAIGRNLIRS
ncbi:MAG TPA: lysylphosphatidylglycerol synthase transmembrane domain-containing protein [Tepidisphaeraceae bacterium]|nr:lysylphosphatidylglycerol synthase transmembrane domain-containing protein [Tepidisphaeraceae bacterium]